MSPAIRPDVMTSGVGSTHFREGMMRHYWPEGGFRVLAVDDDEAVRATYRRVLSSLFQISTADSLASAQCLLEDGANFDALILDLALPGEDTAGFWDWLSSARPELAAHTLVVTGGPGDAHYDTVTRARDGWVRMKPVTPWDLSDALWELLATGTKRDDHDDRKVETPHHGRAGVGG